jgi:hypothetical protein
MGREGGNKVKGEERQGEEWRRERRGGVSNGASVLVAIRKKNIT